LIGAFLWEIWRKNRVELSVSLLAIPVTAVLLRWFFPEPPPWQVAIGAAYPLLIIVMMTISFFCYIEASIKKTTTGFPPHTFLLPIRTETLVAIPMGLGMVAVPGVYIVWALVVYHPVGIPLALGWPTLILAAAMTTFQTVVWTIGARPLPRIAAFTVAVTAFCSLGIAASGAVEISSLVRSVMYVGLPILMFANFRLSVWGVSRFRCGEWPRDSGGRSRQDSEVPVAARSRRLPVLSSPGRAQFWLEWRQFGFLVPTYVAFVLAVLFLLVLVDDLGVGQFWQLLVILTLLPLGMGAMAGPSFARSGIWAGNADLSQFGATRPMTDTALASAKLKSLAASMLAGWLVVFGLGPFWVRSAGHLQLVLDLGQRVDQALAPAGIGPALILNIFALVTLSWILGGLGMSLALSGKRNLFFLAWIGSLLVMLSLIVTAVWTYRHPEMLETMLAWAHRLQWIGNATAVVASLVAFGLARRSGLLTRRLIAAVGIVSFVLLGLIALLAYRVAPTHWRSLAGAAALLVALGATPIATGPLALFANRHR
jgi:hypothetical protein